MTVFANGREISAEAQGCKVIAAFPDTCFTPPENPATPPGVPVPYPDFGFDSDLTSGSGTVKIGNKPISQENSSYYKRCSGDEAGVAAKKGIITSNNMGKVYAQAWSMDVKVEGKGVARFGDMATSNHRSNPGDTPTMVIIGKPGLPGTPSPTPSEVRKACEEAQDELANADLPERFSRIHPDSVTRGEASRKQAYGEVVEATTLGAGRIIGGSVNGSSSMRAHSRSRIGKKYGSFSKGTTNPNGSQAKGCGSGKGFKYRDNSNDHRHAEAKMIEDWASAGMPGTLVLSISRPVCPNCAALIKHVNCASGSPNCNRIIVCTSNQTRESMQGLQCG